MFTEPIYAIVIVIVIIIVIRWNPLFHPILQELR